MTSIKRPNSQQLLAQLAISQSSGCLELNNGEICWKIYLQRGNVKYIYCSLQLLEQLEFFLCLLGLSKVIAPLRLQSASNSKPKFPANEQNAIRDIYSNAISALIKERHLTLSQAAKVIQHLTKDELRRCIWLNKFVYRWHNEDLMPKTIIGNSPPLNLSQCLRWEKARLKQWQSNSNKIFSLHQRPYLVSDWEKQQVAVNDLVLKQLSKIINGRASIRQLSLLLQKDELDVGRMLSPYIDEQIIYLRNPPPKFSRFPKIYRLPNNSQHSVSKTKTHRIVCIDDSPTILQEIKRFLDRETLEIITIEDPTKAVAQIFAIEPDLILLDINMPRVNGYELCRLLKKSKKCDRTPIIMVTGNNGLIDKARAKIVGSKDYLTKPFSKSELIELVEKYL